MKNEVYRITEAFSMQPRFFHVGMKNRFYMGEKITAYKVGYITLEFETEWPNGMQRGEYLYRVYTETGELIAEFKADTVNVEYFIETSEQSAK